jgi:hypothetical protein
MEDTRMPIKFEDVPELLESDFAADVLEFHRLQEKLEPIVRWYGGAITVLGLDVRTVPGFPNLKIPWTHVRALMTQIDDAEIPF